MLSLLFSILIIVALVIYLVVACYQILQFYYLIHPYKVCLVSTQLNKVTPVLADAIGKYVPDATNYNFVELGSGKAGVSRYIYRTMNFKQVIAVEGDWLTYFGSLILTRLAKDNITIINKDIFQYKLPSSSVIYCYLFPKLLNRLFEQGYFQNTVVFSLTFQIESQEPKEVLDVPNFQKKLYIYDFRKS
jgi:16S rRNA A1518/A1519 N6-dimethyltransferase RsmA/KsgA/DIM1 with predicted DNA glycosylase/AP lyase activity